jgi:hypothetical protein
MFFVLPSALYFIFPHKNLAWPLFYQCWNSTTIKTACNSIRQSGRSQHIFVVLTKEYYFFANETVQPDRNIAWKGYNFNMAQQKKIYSSFICEASQVTCFLAYVVCSYVE